MNPPPGIEVIPQTGQWVVAGDTHLGAWAKQHGNIITDPCLFEWLKPRLEGVKVVWDIGANIGDHTRWYLDQGYRVVAVEPNPAAFQCLTHNCPDALCLNIAASDEIGELRFTQLENVGASRITKDGDMVVPAYVLDQLDDLPAPDFIKADLEGFEVFALRGMIETLKEYKPILFIEFNKGALAANGHVGGDIVKLIADTGIDYKMTLYPPKATWGDDQFDVLFTL